MEQEGDGSYDEDPGWPLSGRFLLLFIPFAGPLMFRRDAARTRVDALGALRTLFIAYFNAVIMIGIVALFASHGSGPAVPWLPILLVFAAVAITGSRVFERPLDCSSDAKLASSYRSRFFVRMASGESVALLAFVFTFSGGPKWIYYVGAAITLAYFWLRAAPTRSSLARDQDTLRGVGCGRSLIRVLRFGRSGDQ